MDPFFDHWIHFLNPALGKQLSRDYPIVPATPRLTFATKFLRLSVQFWSSCHCSSRRLLETQTREAPVGILLWASSGHVTTRFMSPQRLRSPMLTFATHSRLAQMDWRRMRSFYRAVMYLIKYFNLSIQKIEFPSQDMRYLTIIRLSFHYPMIIRSIIWSIIWPYARLFVFMWPRRPPHGHEAREPAPASPCPWRRPSLRPAGTPACLRAVLTCRNAGKCAQVRSPTLRVAGALLLDSEARYAQSPGPSPGLIDFDSESGTPLRARAGRLAD